MLSRMRFALKVYVFVCALSIPAGQSASSPSPLDELRTQIQELRSTLNELSGQLAQSRRESDELRKELTALREQVTGIGSGEPVLSAAAPAPQERLDNLSEEQQLLDAKVTDQYQTKVESGSRYRVRVSGLALLNLASTRGTVDQIDVPSVAEPRPSGATGGSFGATARQSQLNLEVFGPDWKGARTSGQLEFDFFGGFPSTPEGISAGLVRLRTAKVGLDWKNTSILAGQDALFFSPLSPTSLASVAYPAFSNAGNLWTWTPQLSVEHRFALSERSRLSLQGGILDPLTGEFPGSEYNRLPTAGEAGRRPAYAMRFGWRRDTSGGPAGLGAGAYYSRQNWLFGQRVDAWAATADWDLPLGPFFAFSGELYRGRAIGGLGGGPNGSVLFLSSSEVVPLESAGGWSQLKFKPASKVELNSAFGMDHAFLSGLPFSSAPADTVRRNLSGMFNVIIQPRSNLSFSAEYRWLRTVRLAEPASAGQVNLGAGIRF